MSKQALEAFKVKLRDDHVLRDRMNDTLSAHGKKRTASVQDLVAFATANGYAFTTDEAFESLELSDAQLEAVSGGANQPHLRSGVSNDTEQLPIESLSFNFSKI